jgi:hypothetical protein
VHIHLSAHLHTRPHPLHTKSSQVRIPVTQVPDAQPPHILGAPTPKASHSTFISLSTYVTGKSESSGSILSKLSPAQHLVTGNLLPPEMAARAIRVEDRDCVSCHSGVSNPAYSRTGEEDKMPAHYVTSMDARKDGL